MHNQVLTALLSTAFLVVALACLVGICEVSNLFFSQKILVPRLIPN